MLIFLAALGDLTTGLVAVVALGLGVFFLMRGPRIERVAPAVADAPAPAAPAVSSRTPAEAAGEPSPVATTFRQGRIKLGGSAGAPAAAGPETSADRGSGATMPSLSKGAGPTTATPAAAVAPKPVSAEPSAPGPPAPAVPEPPAPASREPASAPSEPPGATEPRRLRVTSAAFPGVRGPSAVPGVPASAASDPAPPAAPEPAAPAAPEPAAPEPVAPAAPEPAAPAPYQQAPFKQGTIRFRK